LRDPVFGESADFLFIIKSAVDFVNHFGRPSYGLFRLFPSADFIDVHHNVLQGLAANAVGQDQLACRDKG
jgi:hypothetical protein